MTVQNIMLEGAFLFTAGPPLVQAALGIETTPEELGSARMHATQSGVVHNLVATEQEAFQLARGPPKPRSPRGANAHWSAIRHCQRSRAISKPPTAL